MMTLYLHVHDALAFIHFSQIHSIQGWYPAPPRIAVSPGQRSVKSVDLFIQTPRSPQPASEAIEFKMRKSLQLLPVWRSWETLLFIFNPLRHIKINKNCIMQN
jgi:hypothetical protein